MRLVPTARRAPQLLNTGQAIISTTHSHTTMILSDPTLQPLGRECPTRLLGYGRDIMVSLTCEGVDIVACTQSVIADHLAREAAIVPPSQHPPYPPLYPHPGSLQPWNPWYPPQQSTRAPTGPDPRSNPYEGTREPGPSPPGVSGITVPPISQYPGTSVDGQKVPLGHRSEKGCGVPSVSINETNPQTSPGPATKPELVDAESLMSSVIPVVGSSYPLNLAGDLTKHPTCTSGSEESASDRKQLSGSPTHRKTKNKDDPHHRQHMECRQGRGNPTDAYQQDAVASRGAAKVGQSRQEHDLSPTTDIPLASQSQDNQSERKRQELNAPRSPSLVRGSTRNSGPVERQSAGVVPLLGPHPRWSECLISLAVCIST